MMSDKPHCHYCSHTDVCRYQKIMREFWQRDAQGHAGELFECIAGMCRRWERKQ